MIGVVKINRNTQRENLEHMLGTLLELESELEALEHSKKELKAQIQLIVEDIPDQKAEFPGIGTVQMTKAGTTVSYDKDALESLTAQLLQNGEMRTAQAIADCRNRDTKEVIAYVSETERIVHA